MSFALEAAFWDEIKMRLEPNGKTWTEPMRKRERECGRGRSAYDRHRMPPPPLPRLHAGRLLVLPFRPSVRSFLVLRSRATKTVALGLTRKERKEGERKARQQPSLKEVKDTQYRVPRDSDKVMIRHTGRLDRMLHRKWRETKQRSLL